MNKTATIVMKNITKRILLFPILAGIMLWGTSCVRDGDLPCPNYLRFIYDYNMVIDNNTGKSIDRFSQQVTFLSIFLFDTETGAFVREAKLTGPFTEDYKMEVPGEWFDQAYDIIVWAGLDADSYDFPTLTPGVSSIRDFELKVKGYEAQLVNRNAELEPLWHGKLENVTFSDLKDTTYTVPLMKDTKKVRLVVQCLNDNYTITSGDLDIRILSADGWYDNYNNVLDPETREINFLPYYTADEDGIAIAEMNTLRLMNEAGRINQLQITDKFTGTKLLDISLTKYLNLLRFSEYGYMKSQEYFDREDEYYILVFLEKTLNGWLAAEIKINDWLVREDNVGV